MKSINILINTRTRYIILLSLWILVVIGCCISETNSIVINICMFLCLVFEYLARIITYESEDNSMNNVATFQKVSEEQWLKDVDGEQSNLDLIHILNDVVKIPRRSTVGSAGHDFVSPFDFTLNPGDEIKIPTGIRCQIDNGYVLMIYPRSGLGFKYRLGLANTTGVVDEDYYNANNEGHIFIKMVNNGTKSVSLKAGDSFAQGVFIPYGVADDEEVSEKRTGGFGSTGA